MLILRKYGGKFLLNLRTLQVGEQKIKSVKARLPQRALTPERINEKTLVNRDVPFVNHDTLSS
jgi:hypothetical protein